MVHLYANFSTKHILTGREPERRHDKRPQRSSRQSKLDRRLTSALYIGYNLAGRARPRAIRCAVEIKGCGLL